MLAVMLRIDGMLLSPDGKFVGTVVNQGFRPGEKLCKGSLAGGNPVHRHRGRAQTSGRETRPLGVETNCSLPFQAKDGVC